MSVRTSEELTDRLAADLVWRKKELTVLRKLVSTASVDRKDVLIRSLVAILYAHWEGFIKKTAESYIEYVKTRRLAYSELASHLLAYALLSRVRTAAEQRNLGDMIEVVRLLRGDVSEQSRISKDGIDSGSNLSSRVLHSLTTALGLDYSLFESKAFLIDERLLGNRNRIAHGEYLVLNVEDALGLETEILSLMEHFRDEVENAVALSRYKHSA